MNRYTYRITYYVDVDADNEDQAIEQAEESCPVEPYEVDLYEVEKINKGDRDAL